MPQQSTLAQTVPKAYRLSDRCKLRKRERCCYHDRNILAKRFHDDDNVPYSFTKTGNCTVNPRFAVTYPNEGTYFFCYKHAPDDLIETNMEGDWDDEH